MRAPPFIISHQGSVTRLDRVPFRASASGEGFDEAWLQELLYKHPEVLPAAELDAAYGELVAVCREMRTEAGPVDLVCITPHGRIALVETKLWRNPEARRTVVAQILDYAKELTKWEYSDLQREALRARSGSAASLHELVRNRPGALDEGSFHDQVSRNLRNGQFLLLIAGDGIQQGVEAIAEFLDRFGSLQFTFGLVEICVYELPSVGRLVHAQTLAKTVIMRRTVVAVEEVASVRVIDGTLPEPEQVVDQDPEKARKAAFFREFWRSFLDTLSLQDTNQSKPKASDGTNIYFMLPPSGGSCWVSAFLATSRNRAGVYLTFSRNSAIGPIAWQSFQNEIDEIKEELGVESEWSGIDGKYTVLSQVSYKSLDQPAELERVRDFLRDRVARYVNVFRPRLEKLAATP